MYRAHPAPKGNGSRANSVGVWWDSKSLEELVLESDGTLRVMRIENLVRQGSKSASYGAPQLWLLAEWVLSDAGQAVRRPLAREFVRLLDVAVAGGAPWLTACAVQLSLHVLIWHGPCLASIPASA